MQPDNVPACFPAIDVALTCDFADAGSLKQLQDDEELGIFQVDLELSTEVVHGRLELKRVLVILGVICASSVSGERMNRGGRQYPATSRRGSQAWTLQATGLWTRWNCSTYDGQSQRPSRLTKSMGHVDVNDPPDPTATGQLSKGDRATWTRRPWSSCPRPLPFALATSRRGIGDMLLPGLSRRPEGNGFGRKGTLGRFPTHYFGEEGSVGGCRLWKEEESRAGSSSRPDSEDAKRKGGRGGSCRCDKRGRGCTPK